MTTKISLKRKEIRFIGKTKAYYVSFRSEFQVWLFCIAEEFLDSDGQVYHANALFTIR